MDNMLTEFTMVKGLHESLASAVVSRFDKTSSILDLGAGAGAWLERLGNAGYHNLHGVDKDKERFHPFRNGVYGRENLRSDYFH